jgi:hypothetical protein
MGTLYALMFQIHMLLSIYHASFLHSTYSIVHDVCAFPASAAASNDPGLSAASGRWGGGDAHLTSVSSGPVWVGCGWWTLVSLGSLGQRMDGWMDDEVWINSDEFCCTTYSFFLFFSILTGDMGYRDELRVYVNEWVYDLQFHLPS